MALLFRVQPKDEEQSFVLRPFFGKMPFLILTRKSMLLKSPSKKESQDKERKPIFSYGKTYVLQSYGDES